VVKWFVKFQMDFSTLYFDEPDTTGHGYGPLSIEYKNKVYKKLLLELRQSKTNKIYIQKRSKN
jgi:hypothetical protein